MNGKLYAFEIKWNKLKKAFLSKSFSNTYPEHEYAVIHPGNYEQFIM
jgi:hypothetical protein